MTGQGVGTEDAVVAAWLTRTLEADSALVAAAPGGVWDGPAVATTHYPICEMLMQSSFGALGVGGVEVWQNQLWIVRGVTEGSSYQPLIAIANRVHTLIHRAPVTVVSGGTIHSCVRVQQLRQENVQGGRQLRYLGGIFRIFVQGN